MIIECGCVHFFSPISHNSKDYFSHWQMHKFTKHMHESLIGRNPLQKKKKKIWKKSITLHMYDRVVNFIDFLAETNNLLLLHY